MFCFQFLQGFISQAVKIGAQVTMPICRPISVEELKDATTNFDVSAFIGEGSLGKVPLKHLKCCF